MHLKPRERRPDPRAHHPDPRGWTPGEQEAWGHSCTHHQTPRLRAAEQREAVLLGDKLEEGFSIVLSKTRARRSPPAGAFATAGLPPTDAGQDRRTAKRKLRGPSCLLNHQKRPHHAVGGRHLPQA